MESLVVSWFIIVIETWGSLYFFDTFLEQKKSGKIGRYRYGMLFLMLVSAVRISRWLGIGIWKLCLIVPIFMVCCMLFYRIRWKQCIFFSCMNYCLVLLVDFLLLQVGNIWVSQDFLRNSEYASQFLLLSLFAKMTWLCLLFIMRKIWDGKNDYSGLSNREWMKLSMIPLFTMAAFPAVFFGGDKRIQSVSIFLAVGLIMVNLIVVGLMQGILEKEEQLRENALADQKKESQLAHYRDMQAVYERQGRKMHDYKNQIRTMQVLLKKGDTQAAAALAERLTESISVEMAAVNTNYPVVNAVLNQKFHAAREQGVSMIFRVDDMSGMRLNEEETVILLSNLLDNAIHECMKLAQQGKKAVIHVKLVQEDGKLIFSVRNPVEKKVQVTDGIVLDFNGGMHGVGLMNVKAVVDKYGGDFAVSYSQGKYQAVVMIQILWSFRAIYSHLVQSGLENRLCLPTDLIKIMAETVAGGDTLLG